MPFSIGILKISKAKLCPLWPLTVNPLSRTKICSIHRWKTRKRGFVTVYWVNHGSRYLINGQRLKNAVKHHLNFEKTQPKPERRLITITHRSILRKNPKDRCGLRRVRSSKKFRAQSPKKCIRTKTSILQTLSVKLRHFRPLTVNPLSRTMICPIHR